MLNFYLPSIFVTLPDFPLIILAISKAVSSWNWQYLSKAWLVSWADAFLAFTVPARLAISVVVVCRVPPYRSRPWTPKSSQAEFHFSFNYLGPNGWSWVTLLTPPMMPEKKCFRQNRIIWYNLFNNIDRMIKESGFLFCWDILWAVLINAMTRK